MTKLALILTLRLTTLNLTLKLTLTDHQDAKKYILYVIGSFNDRQHVKS